MVVLNDLDRFHFVMDVIQRVPQLRPIGADVVQEMKEKRAAHKRYIVEYGDDMPEIRDWRWSH